MKTTERLACLDHLAERLPSDTAIADIEAVRVFMVAHLTLCVEEENVSLRAFVKHVADARNWEYDEWGGPGNLRLDAAELLKRRGDGRATDHG